VKNVDAGRSSVIELIHANTADNRMLYATILQALPSQLSNYSGSKSSSGDRAANSDINHPNRLFAAW
jgi:hypothetical protein